jgi:UDP-glucuronate 4-epimerase
MKVLVTGSAGFIGSALSLKLLQRGDDVLGLDCLNDYYDVNLKKARLARTLDYDGYTELRIHLEDREAMAAAFTKHKPARVVNLAAQAGVRYSLENPHAYVDTNLVGFVDVLEGCRHHGVEHLVAHTYSHLYRLPTTGLRFFTVYGPWGRPDMALFLFTRNMLAGKPIDVFNYGKHRRDFTYVDDIVEGVIRVLDRIPEPNPDWSGDAPDSATSLAPYRLYNIGNNKPVQLLHYIEVLGHCLGIKAQMNLLPLQQGDVPDTYADVADLVDDTGYKPSTEVEDGVARFVDWYRDYYST